jgi:uncharacterized metal-binding protein YceD (DUF177 family)
VTDDLRWAHNIVDMPANGLACTREATAAERQAITSALGLLALNALATSYRIRSVAGGAYRLSGKLSAEATQACVVSLEPVDARIESDFDVEFRPDLSEALSDEDLTVLAGPDLERLERGVIPVGRIVFETLSSALDPYPRREDAEFNWRDPHAEEPGKASPFAVLSKLKDRD